MEREIRRVCPCCGKEIKSNEGSTVCPQCGVVHHMQCWEKNNGCCTKGCAASGRYVRDISDIARMQHHKKTEVISQRERVDKERVRRERVDRERAERIERVDKIRNISSSESAKEQCDEYGFTTPKGRMSEKMKSIVQEKLYYYDLKMSRLNLTGGKISWNGSAFLFPVLWMAYRKMYLYALIAWGISIVITMIGWIPIVGWLLRPILSIVYLVCSGMLGNYLYKIHAEKIYQNGSALNPDTQWEFYRRKGGTSRTSVVVALIIIVIVASALSFIGTMIGISSIINSLNHGLFGDLLNELL